MNISTFNVRSLNSPYNWKKLKLVGSCELFNIGVSAIQEHWWNAVGDFSNAALLYENLGKDWRLILSVAVRNTIGASQGGVGFILNDQAWKSLTKAQITSSGICALEFQGNPKTAIPSCYSPTNMSPQSEVESFYNNLNRFIETAPPYNFLIICRDLNMRRGKDHFPFAVVDSTNRNGQSLLSFMIDNEPFSSATKSQKRPTKKITFLPLRTEIDHILVRKK